LEVGYFQSYPAFRRIRLHEFHRLFHHRTEIRRLELVLLAALFDARKIQHVFDQGRKPPTFLADEPEILVLLLRLSDFTTLQTFREQSHRGDGRAQFMRNAGDEVGFQFVKPQLAVESGPRREQSDHGGKDRQQYQRAKHEGPVALASI
jgi:hypothetical protein